MPKSFLSLNDLAEIAGVTPMTVYRWIRYSDLSKQKIGRRYMFRTAEAMAWLENGGPQRAIDARREELGQAEEGQDNGTTQTRTRNHAHG